MLCAAQPAKFTYVKRLFLIAIIFVFARSSAEAAWRVSKIRGENGERVLSVEPIDTGAKSYDGERQLLRSLPFAVREGEPASREIFEESISPELPPGISARSLRSRAWPGSEVRTLVDQGPPKKRIGLTIVGDGYTTQEKAKFFADAQRIADDLFKGDTFRSYLPLFNVYAVFVPSKDSGVTDTVSRDTALGLYRDPPESKRAIEVGNPVAAEEALKLAPSTDFPILLANDDYYGGLGGRYAITTRSLESGTMVLRHELGHNFGNVGEEYHGGYVYQGANFSSSTRVPWAHWSENLRVYEAQLLTGSYPWINLKDEDFTVEFNFPPRSRFGLMVSAVGWETPDDVEVAIDETPLEMTGKYQRDRTFLEPARQPLSLRSGVHRLSVHELKKDGNNVLGLVQAESFPEGFDFDPSHINAYATYDSRGRMVGYRPTHAGCLMREMRLTRFCAVDQENMWVRFLRRVSLIDEVKVSAGRRVIAETPKLGDALSIDWFAVRASGEAVPLPDLKNQREWTAPASYKGRYKVRVSFKTPEVRKPTPDFIREAEFTP